MKDEGPRLYQGLIGGKSALQRKLEAELEEKRRLHEADKKPTPRGPYFWHKRIGVAALLVVWVVVSFWFYGDTI